MLDPSFIQLSFIACAAITGIVMWAGREVRKQGGTEAPAASKEFKSFQRLYLTVYLVAMFADWLQGPYVYALYASYGFTAGDNATLFVAGFGSSMIFGTFIGSMADRIGRKKSASLYCVLYIVSCMTKHVSSYPMLMIGRVTGGIATSLLFSVFDSWLVCEHNARGFPSELLSGTFGLAIFGNSIVAITAGFVSQFAADMMPLSPPPGESPQIHVGGYCGPFDVSICCLIACGLLISSTWTENYGEQQSAVKTTQIEAIKEAGQIVLDSPDILCCGIVCSLFEASMFIFVFQWTPLVTDPVGPKPPYGTIFAVFMVACMLGSRLFSLATQFMKVERVGQGLLAIALFAHAIPVLSTDNTTCFLAFLLFELSVGIYFPMMGTLKSTIVPEGARSTIYNLYRVPLNFIVVGALCVKIEARTAFMFTSVLLTAALVAQTSLVAIIGSGRNAKASYESVGGKMDDMEMGAETVGAPQEA
eukprot:CAMPEP_0115137042 /NCGR_PEP_ID=MMETSP0227-20121206/56754_1 /TAXON_ID=89957 /ORGANISM="Polarella glacialis, Strain CCMP 1383" /LENGTH=474 /DNA_ID=CAMNT_0002544233 /DNA_START=79 /DNA_END=1503 /DNA_ORIENTATION=-